jgi:hypothetical protein
LSWFLARDGPCAIVGVRMTTIVFPATAVAAEQLKRIRGPINDVVLFYKISAHVMCETKLTGAVFICSCGRS